MKPVQTFADFLAALKADGRDIMPQRNGPPDRTLWKDSRGDLWGITTPGWKNPQGEKTFAYIPKG